MSRQRKIELTPIPHPGLTDYEARPWFRTRRLCFSIADWRAFDEAMRITCPYVRYNRWMSNDEERAETPPPIRLTDNICEQADERGNISRNVWMTFDPEYRLEYTYVPPSDPYDNRWRNRYKQSHSGPPYALIRYPCIYRPASEMGPETYDANEINLAIEPNNQQHVAFWRALFSLIGKLSSNRHQVEVSYPDYHYFNRKTVTNLWIGHEARRWALADPRRLLDYTRVADEGPMLGGGIRPIEENWPERRKQALAMLDPALLARSSMATGDGLYHGPANAREAMVRRAMKAKEEDG